MNAVGMGIVIFVVILMAVGFVAGHYATKASYKEADEMNKIQNKK
ncbi:MAG: hypothetical protein QHH06_04000 [Clostridiales bacterium]|nr:hypothetical protein [Eubacteriales bacterium]MDH7565629.1 hypothetical protein [Clostridiales bacterium]